MSRLESLENIGTLISDLKVRIAKLNEALQKVRVDIGKDCFLSRNSCENIKRTIDEISDLQSRIYSETDAMHIKVQGKTISAAEALIQEQYAKYEKLDYINAIENFINELHCIDEEVEKILNEYRQEIKKIVTTLNLKEQELRIKKFVVLKELYETPQERRLEHIASNGLFGEYPYNLLTQFIIPDGIYLGEKQATMPTEIMPATLVRFESVTEEVVAENEPTFEPALEAGEMAGTDEIVVVPEQDAVESESRVIVAPDESVLYAGEVKKIFDGHEEVKKTFKAKSVRSDFNNTSMPGVLNFIADNFFFNFKWVKALTGEEMFEHHYFTDKFAQKGYLKKFVVFDEVFYAITDYGVNVFKSPLLTRVLELRTLNLDQYDTIYKNITGISVWSCMQNTSIAKRLRDELNWGSTQVYCGPNANGVIIRKEENDNSKKVCFIGIFDNDLESIGETADLLMEKDFRSVDYLIVQSSDDKHARAVAKWVRDNYMDRERLKGLYCFITMDSEIHDVDTDAVIDISDIKVALYDEEDAVKDIMGLSGLLKLTDGADDEVEDVVTVEEEITVEVAEEIVEETIEETIEETMVEIVEDLVDDKQVDASDADNINTTSEKESVTWSEAEPVAMLGNELTEADEIEYLKKFNDMLVRNQFAVATAYLKALANRYPSFGKAYELMAYAVNDPMMKCSYSSDNILALYDLDGFNDDYLFMSAAIRCAFSDQYAFDYGLNGLLDFAKGLPVEREVPGIIDLFDNIVFFKNQYGHGMDRYAGYRKNKNVDVDKELNRLAVKVNEGMKLFTNPGKKGFTRLIETRGIIFGKNSDLIECLNVVSAKKKDNVSVVLTMDYVSHNFIKDGTDLEFVNIDNAKIDKFIDDAWDKARERMAGNADRTSKLMSSLRNSLISQINTAVEILIDYCNLLNDFEDDSGNEAVIFYKGHEDEIASKAMCVTKKLRGLYKGGNGSSAVLIDTINEILERMDGTYDNNSYKYFYKDLLKTKYVLLNDAYIPYLLDVDERLPEMSPIRRLEQHFNSEQMSFEERLKSIIYDEEDNFGSIDLILGYLNDTVAPEYGETFRLENNYDASFDSAMKALNIDAKKFVEKLELSYSYGQIDNPVAKEDILQNAEVWLERAKEMKNLGLYKEITDAYLANIRREALHIGNQHLASLEDYKIANGNWDNDENIRKAVATIENRIKQQNYSAAEDLLNRLAKGEVFEDEVSDYIDYLQDFLSNYSYHYSEASNMRVNFTQTLGKRLGHKDKRGAEKLSNAWIAGTNNLKEVKVKELLEALRFEVDTVTKKPEISKGIHNYVIRLKKAEFGRKKNYSHPISAFGSYAEEKDFRVAFIFGNEDERKLLEKFKEIGEAMPTLLFLDSALSEASRRTIARKAKEEFGQIFAVVDRVVFSYLVNNFTETAVQQMLMALTMPYTYYQPYVFSSQNAIPPELFIGRREELRKIIDPAGVNIVYGGRQLGKSALLKKALADVDHNEINHRAFFVDIINKDYEEAAIEVHKYLSNAKILSKRVEVVDWESITDGIYERMTSETKEEIPYLLLLLDEADEFIASSATVKYKPIEDLKKLQEKLPGRFKFVMAGLRNVVRFDKNLALGGNSVLAHLTSLTVKPFSFTEAKELLEKPLFYLGFRLGKDEKTSSLLSSIFSNTNYFPGLIQLYCANLIESLKKKDYAGYAEADTPPYVLSETHVQKILGEKELQKEIKDKFFITLTLDNDVDNYYMLIALLVAYKYHEAKSSNAAMLEGCTPRDILTLANDFGVMKFRDFTDENMYALMEEMKELNVLQEVGNNGYRFSRYNFLHMMGTEEEVITAIGKAAL